jgi:hypothetical protein
VQAQQIRPEFHSAFHNRPQNTALPLEIGDASNHHRPRINLTPNNQITDNSQPALVLRMSRILIDRVSLPALIEPCTGHRTRRPNLDTKCPGSLLHLKSNGRNLGHIRLLDNVIDGLSNGLVLNRLNVGDNAVASLSGSLGAARHQPEWLLHLFVLSGLRYHQGLLISLFVGVLPIVKKGINTDMRSLIAREPMLLQISPGLGYTRSVQPDRVAPLIHSDRLFANQLQVRNSLGIISREPPLHSPLLNLFRREPVLTIPLPLHNVGGQLLGRTATHHRLDPVLVKPLITNSLLQGPFRRPLRLTGLPQRLSLNKCRIVNTPLAIKPKNLRRPPLPQPVNTLRQLARFLGNGPGRLNSQLTQRLQFAVINRPRRNLTSPAINHRTRHRKHPDLIPNKGEQLLKMIQPSLLTGNPQILKLHRSPALHLGNLTLIAGLKVRNRAGRLVELHRQLGVRLPLRQKFAIVPGALLNCTANSVFDFPSAKRLINSSRSNGFSLGWAAMALA